MNIIKALVAKYNKLQAAYEAWNFKEYDAHQQQLFEKELATSRRVSRAYPNYYVAGKLDSYAEWYKEVLAVTEARRAIALAKVGYNPMTHAEHVLLAQAYAMH